MQAIILVLVQLLRLRLLRLRKLIIEEQDPDLFGGVTIGNGKIKIGIPGIDKDIVLEAADIDHFKSCLK